eukprot:scaffold4650_cov36-Prasinocladus_malaysianus.AAC.1
MKLGKWLPNTSWRGVTSTSTCPVLAEAMIRAALFTTGPKKSALPELREAFLAVGRPHAMPMEGVSPADSCLPPSEYLGANLAKLSSSGLQLRVWSSVCTETAKAMA